jgi:hypothetical protein
MKNSIRRLMGIVAAATVIALTGCAAPASKEAMEVPALPTTKRFAHSVQVKTIGGSETQAGGGTNVSDSDLKAAIEASISKAQLFSTVMQGKGGDYELSVVLTNINKPMMGFSMTVDVEAGWSLTRVSDRTLVMRKQVQSTHTVGATEAFAGVKRVQMALEGAVRKNIEQGLLAIAEQNL